MEVQGAMSGMLVSMKDVKNILESFKKTTYKPHEGKTVANEALNKCLELFKIDYSTVVLENVNAELSTNYPGLIPIPEHELNQNQTATLSAKNTDTIYENSMDGQRLQELSHRARLARCRGRFPVPVILCKGKYICRSSTLSGGPEMYGRSSYDFLFNPYEPNQKAKGANSTEASNYETFVMASTSSSPPTEIPPQKPGESPLFDRVRNSDITLLKSYNIGTIVDLMVEKKKVKYGFHVTSSEKVDKENRYNQFTIISLPYPGCEFFKEYRDNNYEGSGLTFNWGQAFIDAHLNVSEDLIPPNLNIAWDEYTKWDLETITKNYLKFLLKYFNEKDSGLLVHCISGWDRTPLFISLLRLSLWADGLIHQSLDPQQILYLTIAYDWFLFGHHLNDRLSKGEDIFFFCFNVIKHLMGEDYSIQQAGRKAKVPDKPTRTDLDSILEPIMLECDIRGSNISLNSISSSVSNKSHDFFYTYVQNFEDVSNISNGNQVVVNADPDFIPARSPQSNGNQFAMESCSYSPKSPQSNGNESINELDTSPVKSPNSQRTSPVTVPATKLRTRQESSSSLSLSSWHLISGTGSIRDGDSSDNNGLNANSDCSSIISGHTVIDDTDVTDPLAYRSHRLKRVRELFFNAYPTTVGFRTNEEQNSFGQILGNIAEKVGLSGGK